MAEELLASIRAEIDTRRRELRPLVAEYERLLSAAGGLEADARPTRKAPRTAARRATAAAPAARAPRGAAQQAILAALEHGSHTLSELLVVTAMAAPNVRENLRRLLTAGAVTRARRDGKTAYALAPPTATRR